jgi:hypothetical protein
VVLGSVADDLIHHVPCPILVIPLHDYMPSEQTEETATAAHAR